MANGSATSPMSTPRLILVPALITLGITIVRLVGELQHWPKFLFKMILGMLFIASGAVVQFFPWPSLAKTLLAYGYAARIPVAVVMFFAIRSNWGTHYDVLPPNYTGPMDFWGKYFMIGLVPQLLFWVAYTVVLGSLCGGIAAAVKGRGKSVAPAA